MKTANGLPTITIDFNYTTETSIFMDGKLIGTVSSKDVPWLTSRSVDEIILGSVKDFVKKYMGLPNHCYEPKHFNLPYYVSFDGSVNREYNVDPSKTPLQNKIFILLAETINNTFEVAQRTHEAMALQIEENVHSKGWTNDAPPYLVRELIAEKIL